MLFRILNLPIDRWESRNGIPARSRDDSRAMTMTMTKILLVEDSKFLRLATERALARAGYETSSAVDGEEALRVAREKMPDLILLDMLLPKMSGPDVLKALKEED